ncbi:MAG: glycosyltransferase family 4 protein [Elusimicrobia bacterium]|nr:glycosyltransferase family 4 protein [Elusimicrobiota bacterium]
MTGGPRRVKVAHLITLLELGGAQQNTLHTVSNLDPARFEPLLACGEGGVLDTQARALDRDCRVRVRFMPDLAREIDPLRDLSALLQLQAFLTEERPEIVHTHSSKAGVLGRLAARLAGVPIIIHSFHGFGFHDYQSRLVKGLWIALERLCAAVSARLIFVSKANQDAAAGLKIGDPSRYALIRSGVRLADFPAKLRSVTEKKAALGFDEAAPIVVSVGNLKPQKNAADFIRLASRVLREVPEARFFFVGDGALRPKLEAEVLGCGLSGKVFFAGWRSDVPEVLAAADVFVLTSLWEGLPRALVEALRTGLPCACYAADGVADVLREGENGFLARPGDWEGLAAKVTRLLKDPGLRHRIRAAAFSSIGDEFDIDGMVRRQETLYEELLARAGIR